MPKQFGRASRGELVRRRQFKRPKPPRRTASPWHSGVRAEPDDRGIVVSIGPRDRSQRWVKQWMTFPVTPESIPVTVSSAWQENVVLGRRGGEFSTFGGRNLDSISFSGRLEPPLYYTAGTRPRGVPAVEFGGLDEEATRRYLNNEARIPRTSPMAFPSLTVNQRVVMDAGARAGPNDFYEPHTFKEIVTKAVKHGEVVKLVIGDSYGWYGDASIREFSWRYEDPDPDVLMFDISFRQHRDRELAGVTSKTKRPTKKTHTTARFDTLFSIAQRHLGSGKRWKDLRKLNANLLSKLWLREIDNPTGGAVYRPSSMLAVMPSLSPGEIVLAYEKRITGSRRAPKDWPPHLAFAEGIKLRLR